MPSSKIAGGLVVQKLWNTDSQLNELFNQYSQSQDIKKVIGAQLARCRKLWYTQLTPEEVKQIGDLALWDSLRKYEIYDGGPKFTTYLYDQVKYQYLNYMNYDKISTMPCFSDLSNDEEREIDRTVKSRDYEVEVADLLDGLPPKTKAVIAMRFYENRTLKEIARHFNFTVQRAHQIINVGLETMREDALRVNHKQSGIGEFRSN
jgi:RNA polymerase sigma factor (sigma-70 family)